MKKLLTITILTITVGLFSSNAAHALVPISGSTGLASLGAWEGSLDYSYTNSTTAELEVKLKNTSPVSNGGYITAFVFNNPLNLITAASLTASDSDFSIIGPANFQNTINAMPFGQFDLGASTKNAFQGGGAPQKGIAVGVEETFKFSLTGTNLDTLTENIFLDTLSEGNESDEGYQSFVVRFRGFEDGGSDKVPSTHSMPEPGTLALFGIGAAGAYIRRKFQA